MRFKLSRILLKLLVATILILWLSRKEVLNLDFLFETLTWKTGVVCGSLVFLQLVLNNWRWKILLASRDILLSFKETFRLTFIGLFFNFAVPGGVGGDVVKGYYLLRKYPEKKMEAGTTILIDRIFGVVAMLILSCGVLFFQWQNVWRTPEMKGFFLIIIGLLVGILSFALLGFSDRFYNWSFFRKELKRVPKGDEIFRLLSIIHLYGKKTTVLMQGVFISLLSQLCPVLFAYYLGRELGSEFSFLTYLFVMPLTILATVLPIAPAGIGVGQAAIYFLFKSYTGVESDIGPSIMTLFQMLSLMWGLVGAVFYVSMKSNLQVK